MTKARTLWLAALTASILLTGCVAPKDRRPGMLLRGEVASAHPLDWSFTDQYREIAVEVRAPYLLRHSVTIWCAAAGGHLYLGARDPEGKRWPGWVERNPDVRLKIGDQIYEARLVRIEAPGRIEAIRRAYARKYEIENPPPAGAPPVRYWEVRERG